MRRFTAVLASALMAVAGATAVASPAAADRDEVPEYVFTGQRAGNTDIYLARKNGTVARLTKHPATDTGAVWSPDGRRLAFVSFRDGDAEIMVMNADGSRVRQLTRNGTDTDGAPIEDMSPAWSPDGRQIVFSSGPAGGGSSIYRMKADGSRKVRLTSAAPDVRDVAPSFSPDGRHVLFSSDRVAVFNAEIFRMRADGTEVERLTFTANSTDDIAGEYSPDGDEIVFSSTREAGISDIYVMNADGSGVHRVGGDPELDDVFPKWTRDGRRIMYHSFSVPTLDAVWIVDRDGEDNRMLSEGTAASLPDPRPRS